MIPAPSSASVPDAVTYYDVTKTIIILISAVSVVFFLVVCLILCKYRHSHVDDDDDIETGTLGVDRIAHIQRLQELLVAERRRRRELFLEIAERQRRRDLLEGLPTIDYSNHKEKIKEDDECAICLEGFGEGQNLRSLPPCNHIYHKACVDPWLLKTKGCPLCRQIVFF